MFLGGRLSGPGGVREEGHRRSSSPQVIKDYLPRKARALEDMSIVERQNLQAGTAAALRVSLAAEVSEQDARTAKSFENELKLLDKQRKHNRHFLEQLDSAVLGATGHGMAHFLPQESGFAHWATARSAS